ncbi:regulatory protein YycH of two-component signal transduction system YycFG [Anaerosolibacter carboniphilus]|uniref:Regulatory protein YycH of two-component signal transduction system YycFG n=2 Tax=Anaerosolibacter carboniphilus TaxID=1417629 RepID=A0A841KQX0_9FIRM|nr:regulatory protein YycH of two-component signal transduction system YycFG [Anaerosolibacter carboniphilus]
MRKESFKTILLAVLVVLSIALTQQLWITMPTASGIPSSKEKTLQADRNKLNEVNSISDVINPQSFVISFGGKDHTVLFSDSHGIWKEVLPILRGYFEDGITVEDITPARWEEISDIRAIKMEFGYSMPIGILSSIVGGKGPGIQGKIIALDSILIPVSEDGVIYISDKFNGRFFRLLGKINKDKVAFLIDQIGSQYNYDYYSSIRQVYAIDNNVLVPLDLSRELLKIKVENEINVEGLKQASTYASTLKQIDIFASAFFGENFDFVKKIIQTDGSVIYMYGYGQKVLKVSASGAMEYVEGLDNNKATASTDITESIKTAVQFVISREITPGQDIYLRDIRPIGGNEGDKRKGYQLLFANRINGLPVYVKENPSQASIEVQVFGKQVTSYKKLLLREKIDVSFIPPQRPEPLAIYEVIDINAEIMKRDLGLTGDEDKVFNDIMTKLASVQLCYYGDNASDKGELIPVWKIQIEDGTYFFDAMKGNIINRMKAKI